MFEWIGGAGQLVGGLGQAYGAYEQVQYRANKCMIYKKVLMSRTAKEDQVSNLDSSYLGVMEKMIRKENNCKFWFREEQAMGLWYNVLTEFNW